MGVCKANCTQTGRPIEKGNPVCRRGTQRPYTDQTCACDCAYSRKAQCRRFGSAEDWLRRRWRSFNGRSGTWRLPPSRQGRLCPNDRSPERCTRQTEPTGKASSWTSARYTARPGSAPARPSRSKPWSDVTICHLCGKRVGKGYTKCYNCGARLEISLELGDNGLSFDWD